MTDFTNQPMYYYLHTNGRLIAKGCYVVNSMGANEYFDSPFVVKWWHIDTEEDYEKMLKEVEELK